jgi:hypothetical protein
MKRLTEEKKREVRALLKAAYDAIASEECPKHMDALLKRLQ